VSRYRERPIKTDKKRAISAAFLHLVPADAKLTPQERGFADCPCPKKCSLHGECNFCIAYHSRKRALPRCER
jgi:hypothetical protein